MQYDDIDPLRLEFKPSISSMEFRFWRQFAVHTSEC